MKGIGPYFSKQLVKVLGISVIDIMEHTPDRLAEVPGFGKKRRQKILRGVLKNRGTKGNNFVKQSTYLKEK